jgi:hypothetical protein
MASMPCAANAICAREVVQPVKLISSSTKRLAYIAALRIVLAGLLPVVATIALALSVSAIGSLIWAKSGYVLEPGHAVLLRQSILGLAVLEFAVVVALASRAWTRASDFVATAERIDDLVDSHQEILTLATLLDPTRSESRQPRTPLFPLLWRRAVSYLDMFDPRREFRIEPGEPLKRSSLFALAVIILLGLATLALVHPPTTLQTASYRLRQFARRVDAPGGTANDHELARAATAVANDLDSPTLPIEQKLAELEKLRQEIGKTQSAKRAGQSGSGNSGRNSGSGEGAGDGKGEGGGKGSGGTQRGAGEGQGKGNKSDPQTLELRNAISKAQVKLEQESKANEKSNMAQGKSEQQNNAPAPTAGENPNLAGVRNKPTGTDNIPLPQGGNLAQNRTPAGSKPGGRKDDQGSRGDTHLGEMPKAANYERFYKPGEQGPPVAIRDARYVTFRLPTEVVSAGDEGRTVRDGGHPTAAAPYTNAPLKDQRLAVSPDERQLVPPRYRELIR